MRTHRYSLRLTQLKVKFEPTVLESKIVGCSKVEHHLRQIPQTIDSQKLQGLKAPAANHPRLAPDSFRPFSCVKQGAQRLCFSYIGFSISNENPMLESETWTKLVNLHRRIEIDLNFTSENISNSVVNLKFSKFNS